MDKFKIRELGLNLNLNAADVDSILENNKDNINEAAYKVLHKWFQGQSGRTTAYVNLVQALHGSDLSMIVSDAFGNKSAYRIGEFICGFIYQILFVISLFHLVSSHLDS